MTRQIRHTLIQIGLLAASGLLSLGVSIGAAAESPNPPRQFLPAAQGGYGLDWIQWITPEDLPPSRYAICLVDSGLAVTPDVPATSPAGPILERLSTDDGSGEPQGTSDEQLHGTKMAMAAIAPVNDWGTIGVWPEGRIISVRAMVGGETTFRGSAYREGLRRCRDASSRIPIAVANLSLNCACELSPHESELLAESIATSHEYGHKRRRCRRQLWK